MHDWQWKTHQILIQLCKNTKFNVELFTSRCKLWLKSISILCTVYILVFWRSMTLLRLIHTIFVDDNRSNIKYFFKCFRLIFSFCFFLLIWKFAQPFLSDVKLFQLTRFSCAKLKSDGNRFTEWSLYLSKLQSFTQFF